MSIPGGIGDVKPADEEIRAILNEVKLSVEEELGKQFETFSVHSYKTQVVAGTNYFVKVKVSDSEALHLRIYKHFSGSVSLHGVVEGKTLEDRIEYFEKCNYRMDIG